MTRHRVANGPEWRILVVDDDMDVHSVTQLVLKNKKWRNQPFRLRSAYSQAEATEILREDPNFHVALVDVVMEKEDSGLELCRLIRETCPRSTRIVLRTGQPGTVPEEEILNEWDIDYYLHKLDVTPEKLFSVVRACLRSSQDISTLLAYGKQLQSFTRALQYVSTVDDLVVFMGEALRFLELKHNCATTFCYDLTLGESAAITTGRASHEAQHGAADQRAMCLAHDMSTAPMQEFSGESIGLDEGAFVIVFEAREEKLHEGTNPAAPVLGGIAFKMNAGLTESSRRDLAADARLFIENWCIAFSTLRLRDRLSQEQDLRNQMYQDRLESIATMVTGVAHELNTPLGVARTAGSVVTDLSVQLINDGDVIQAEEAAADLEEAVRLMNKNLDRAHRLIQSFRQLSASQLSDERVAIGLDDLIRDCLETMGPDLRKHRVTPQLHSSADDDFTWCGYPGHLSQVIINLIQNTIRYAYDPGAGGAVDIYVEKREQINGFRVRFTDYGKGVSNEIKPRMFDAFVTSGREVGGTGLGLAIARNIVVNLLHGEIICESTPGHGTTFSIDLPACDIDQPDHICRADASLSLGQGGGFGTHDGN
ncbi:ATP-binding protein [Streptomyces sp. NPDC053431]|uniref:ATP-binding protein n=1 Tax=Streptomyces sp. NPDC053431 TaxID=3365703 RepID=UPI0037D3CD8B